MLFENVISRTIEFLAEAERNVALKQRLSRQNYGIISGQDEIDPGVPMVGSLITNTGNSQKTNGTTGQAKDGRSDLSDLLQRLSVLTAVQDRCAAMTSGTAEEQIGWHMTSPSSSEGSRRQP